ncbi:unnamed protein product [Rhizophagus irregularis]|uniref:Uncharacterized protein n=1 Tax=Rhizophagus irregularis TaxID=588596 RepID=A0A915YSS9_9GLOM|nr:unnamed protein product [Rhizophagus irregularis]
MSLYERGSAHKLFYRQLNHLAMVKPRLNKKFKRAKKLLNNKKEDLKNAGTFWKSKKKNHETSIVSLSTKRRQLINCTISKSDSNQVKDFGEDVQLIVFVLGHVKIMMDS